MPSGVDRQRQRRLHSPPDHEAAVRPSISRTNPRRGTASRPRPLIGMDASAGLAGEPMAHTLHQRAESVFASRGPASAWASWFIDVVIAKIIERDLAVSRSPDEDQQL